jgi:beta-glucosidase
VPARAGFVSDPEDGRPGVRVTILDAAGELLEERHPSTATTVVGFDDDFEGTVHTVRFRARVDADGPVEVGAIGAGSWTLRVGDRTEGFDLRVAGTGFGEEILAPPTRTLQVDLSGPEVVEAEVVLQSDTGEGAAFAAAGLFGLVARPATRPEDDVVAEAVRAAAEAEVAVVVVGLTEEQETEAVDKSTLRLPGAQDRLVSAVAAVAQRTVVVVNAATPVLMPWRNEVDAILWAGLPGQEAGHAVAAALVGEIEPAGRLVTTFPVEDGAAPAWSVTPVDGDLRYTEGTFIGYRGHHAGTAPTPAFWLGHGLGYSTWEYADATVTEVAGAPAVRVTVTNTGSRPSREVVQVYFEPDDEDQPVRLVGWSAVEATPGQQVDVEVAADRRLWRSWDTTSATWRQLPDAGRLLVARGLGDVRAALPLGES